MTDTLTALEEWKRIRKTTLGADYNDALEEWKRIRGQDDEDDTKKKLRLNPKNYPVGKFNNLDSIRLRWLEPIIYDFIPKKDAPFSFTRQNGQVIEPRRMFTDGGSIPRFMYWNNMMDPWRFAPAYFLHDWLVVLNHCAKANKTEPPCSFAEANDILMEGIMTMNNTGLSTARSTAMFAIDVAINSFIAKKLWDCEVRVCPIPPDMAE